MTGPELESAYRDHGHMVLRRARRILGNEEEARDIVQELFTQLARGRGFQGRSSVTTFLYAATTNLCLTRIRNQKTRARLLAARPPAAETAAASAETRVILAELLGELAPELADVAVYYHADEMTHEEIAEVVGCSRRHVGNLVAAAIERLQRRA